jgi:iron complex transport system substrate-binding protein
MAGKPSLTRYLSISSIVAASVIFAVANWYSLTSSGVTSSGLAGSALANNPNKLSLPSRASCPVKPRIASLAPSNTELLCSVGAKDQIIGVSSFCDYPKDVAGITKVGTFISANLERLARLKPDLVMLVSGQEELAGKIKNHHIKTVVIENENLTDIGKNLRRIGELTGHCQEGEEAAQEFEAKLQELAKIIDKGKQRPKVFYCVWPQPLMTAGKASFINGIITSCGGINVAGNLPISYPRFSMERLVLSNPDLIIMPYEARNQAFIKQSPWNKLKAVRQNRVYYLPDQKNDMLSRPTLRVLKGMAWLGGVFHPELRNKLVNWSEPTSVAKASSKSLETSTHNSFNNVYMRN